MSEDINVGAISEALNNKVDLNQLNTNTQGLSYGSGWNMPSTTYTEFSSGASGTTYTMPKNGWFIVGANPANTNAYIAIGARENNQSVICMTQFASNSFSSFDCYIPVTKGQIVTVNYLNLSLIYSVKLVHAKGEQ